MYTLIIEDQSGRSTEFSFEQGSYNIGRVDGNDVVLPSSSVSRTHARIFVANNKCYIDDLGSANGVQIDGNRIKERTEIHRGSQIRIGEYTLFLEYKDKAELNAGQDVLKTQIVSGEQSGYKIVRVGDKFGGEEFTLSETSNSIGRTEDNYIMLSHASISRNHAKIIFNGMVFKVIDLNSSNGTYVNNKKVPGGGESILQNGDLIRFGDLSFVFVPTSQTVDPRQYVKKGSDNRRILIVFFCLIIVILLGVVIFSIYLLNSPKNNPVQQPVQQVQEETPQQIAAKLKTQLDDAEKYYEDAHFKLANDIIEPLLEKHPDDARVKELNEKIQAEIGNQKYFDEAIILIDNRKFKAAIVNFEQIDEDSKLYEKAQEEIKKTTHKLHVAEYNDIRSRCEENITPQCIEELCEAAKQLNNSEGAEHLNDAIKYMQLLSGKTKMKYSAAAKKCHKELSSL